MTGTSESAAGVAERGVVWALAEVFDDSSDRRDHPRRPYFGPVAICADTPQATQQSAFARDVSPFGIGLIHTMPIAQRRVIVVLQLHSGDTIAIRTEIVWHKDYGDGWFASGGRFLDIIPPLVATDSTPRHAGE